MRVEQIVEGVRACARGGEPKPEITAILKAHKCHPLLKQTNSQADMMERAVNISAVKERYRACEFFFKNAEFPYAVVKGAVLSEAVCNDPFRRVSGDVDILINRRDADKAKRLLRESGFVQGRVTDGRIVPFARKEILFYSSASHQTAPYIKKTHSLLCPYVNVDVNMDILWGESEERADMDHVLSEREKYALLEVDFYKLKPEMEFIALCLHHYKDMNSIYLLSLGGLSLGCLCDIYFYVKNVTPSVRQIVRISSELNVGRYVYVCLKHTMEIFLDPILTPYIEALEQERDDALLNGFGLNDIERKQWDIPLAARIFHPDLPGYMRKFLTDADLKKIQTNRENM
ncbi:MAG: hypothetical protein E7589_04045 [Ruminococcaceae bacterium]|nr:hypothetical protein [Oscillospiraceae bacterium]